MILLSLAALSLAQAAGQEPASGRITLTTGLLPAEKTLAELSKATGLQLRTTASTADFPLFIRVKEADPRLVLAKVADLLGAEWKQEGAAYVLSSDSAYRRKLARVADARRIARLGTKLAEMDAATRNLRFDDAFAGQVRKDGEKMFEGMMKALTEGGTAFDPSTMFSSTVFTQSPASRAINSLLAGIGAANLAALVPGERVVYALNPTRMQGALPPGSRQILSAFVQGSTEFSQAMKNTGTGEGFDPMTMMGGGNTKTGKGPVADAHLELWPADGMLTATLQLFDANGDSLGQGFGFVDLSAPTAASSTGGEPLVVSELSREWGVKLKAASEGMTDLRNGPAAFSAMFGGGAATSRSEALARPMSPALKTLIADPGDGSFTAPLFEPIAMAMPGDLIATVPDSGLSLLAGLIANERTTAAQAIAALEGSPHFSVTKDGTLTLVGAATPARLHREFADRRALRDLVAAIGRTGYLRLDDAARYALAQRSLAGAINLGSPFVTLLQGKSPLAFMGDPLVTEFETLRIYGSLGEAQRTALASGRGVPYTALSGDAADALSRLLFDSPVGPFPSLDEEGEGENTDPEAMMALFTGMNTRGAERTVRFADGVPRQGYFTLKTESEENYRMTDSSTGATTFGDAGMLGFLRGAKDIPFLKNFASSANYDRFTPAKSRSLNFRFVFGPKLATMRTLQDQEVTSTESLTYDRLPKEFREGAEEAAKAAAFMKAPPSKIKP